MKDLFDSFFRGAILPQQEQELWEYISASKENAEAFRYADGEWRNSPDRTPQLLEEYHQLQKIRMKRHRQAVAGKWSMASAIAAACLAVVVALLPADSCRHKKGTFQSLDAVSEHILPDGSLVNLNKGTTLSFDFTKKNRKVTLDGEALFDVEHNPSAPFVVTTKECWIKVLGTRFSVMDYSADSNAQVVLAEGSLKLDMRGMADMLVPGDKVYFNGIQLTKTKVDVAEVDSWKSGAILFDSIALGDFVNRLSREYGVEVKLLSPKYSSSTFRASFPREEFIENILQSVCEIFPLHLVRDGDGYILE